jgi:hypothetical protein
MSERILELFLRTRNRAIHDRVDRSLIKRFQQMHAERNAVLPIERLMRPIQAFTKLEAAGGILLIACTIIALVWANSPWAASYFHLWHINVTFGFGRAQLSEELHF